MSSSLKIGLVFCFSTFAFLASAGSIYNEPMLKLHNGNSTEPQIETLAKYQGKPLLTSFFMPNCRWCQRQHRVLKKIHQTCPTIQTVMLGVQGNKQKLRHELIREKNTFPAFLANNNIIQAIGTESPIPMMLLFNSKGTLIFKTVGYTPEEKLIALLVQNNMHVCQA